MYLTRTGRRRMKSRTRAHSNGFAHQRERQTGPNEQGFEHLASAATTLNWRYRNVSDWCTDDDLYFRLTTKFQEGGLK
jgi:hypothetical protein